MGKKRIGTDLYIDVIMSESGASADLTSVKNLTVEIIRQGGSYARVKQAYTVSGNIISLQYSSTENVYLGAYGLIVRYERESAESENGYNAYYKDYPDAFMIVKTTEAETITGKLVLSGDVSIVGKDGLSAYEIAVKHGYAGSEEEWLTYLRQPAENVESSENNRVAAEDERVTAEKERATEEEKRKTAETARDTAEKARVKSETDRVAAETARDTSEKERVSNGLKLVSLESTCEAKEKDRCLAEYERADNEKTRIAKESTRIESEIARDTAEKARATAETARDTAEKERKTAEAARDTAEKARVKSETDRVTTETTRQTNEDTRKINETARQAGEKNRETAYTAAEGASTDDASETGSRWQRFKAAEVVRNKTVSDSVSDFPTVQADVERVKRDIGYNASSSTVKITAGVTGKYVKAGTRAAVANTSFAISDPITVGACSEVLIKTGFNPSDSDHAALDISIISFVHNIERQKQVQKTDADGNLLYYQVEQITSDEGTTNTIVTDTEGATVTAYPVYVSQSYVDTVYTPNNEDKYVSIPDSGYYVANIPDAAKIVISYKPGVTDLDIIVVKHGAFANIVSQLGMLAFKERLPMVQSIAQLFEDLVGLRQIVMDNIHDLNSIPKVMNVPSVLYGAGVPSATIVPDNWPSNIPWDGVPFFVGQIYIDTTAKSGGMYHAVGNDSVANWII